MAVKHSVKESAGFGSLVRDISRLIRKQFEKKSSSLGLTQAQFSVISHLLRHEGVNQATLAEMMDIEPITLVGLLDRLESAGWVERRADPADRRARLLYLTRKVQPILEKMDAIKIMVRKAAFAGVSTEDQKKIMIVLQKVRSNLVNKNEFLSNSGDSDER